MKNMLKILIIEDNEADRVVYQRYLSQAFGDGVEVFPKEKCIDALLFLSKNTVDCILMDYHLPDHNGIDCVKEISKIQLNLIPVIMMTGQGSELIAVQALRSGISDYLVKDGLDPSILKDTILSVIQKNNEKKKEKIALDEMSHHAYYDHLTQIPNRFLFEENLSQSLSTAKRHKKNIAVVFLDLDGFKNINDTLGHDVGDIVLTQVVSKIQSVLRREDLLARLGGDEFGIIINNYAKKEDIDFILEKIINVLNTPCAVNSHQVIVTCSVGIALYPDDGDSLSELLKKSDAAMYQSKKAGKNTYRYSD